VIDDALWTPEPVGTILLRVVLMMPPVMKCRLVAARGETVMPSIADLIDVPTHPDDRDRIVRFRRHLVALAAELEGVHTLLGRLCRVDYIPDGGWPPGSVLAAAAVAHGAVGQVDLTDVLEAVGELLAALPA
jgi:hypothetical protein